jgi:hypothetical protein
MGDKFARQCPNTNFFLTFGPTQLPYQEFTLYIYCKKLLYENGKKVDSLKDLTTN